MTDAGHRVSGRVALGTEHFACSLEGLARDRIQIVKINCLSRRAVVERFT
jgi:hypothetical protein